ncbi:hypothetical protein NW759_017309 [Fusarium solani]|nr:hypothetical protein NW759_017309 [Fusarium solani]
MYFRARFQPGDQFIYGIFGIQYRGEKPTGRQLELIDTFDKLIDGRSHFDRILCPGPNEFRTRIWLSYWWPDKYEEWWTSPPVTRFWSDLPDDAGVWREILTVPASRTQNAVTHELKNGVNGLGEMEASSEHSGYWGCMRDRLSESSPEQRFKSPLDEVPERVPEGPSIRKGRIIITELPDNICFLVEGQDHSLMVPEERTAWFEKFDDLTDEWMHDLEANAAANGLLDVRMGCVVEFGKFRDKGKGPVFLDYNRKIELFYWLDIAQFERVGRSHKGHIKLRKDFMTTYSVGKLGSGIGKCCLWEETSVMKGSEIQAEYVGCREGTGFMGYDETGKIKSQVL